MKKHPFENPLLNWFYYTSTTPRERARQERLEKQAKKKKSKLKKKHVKRKIS